jgi:putative transposase
MGTVGDCYDNAMRESFWGTLQLEVLDSRPWETRAELATAIFEWRECWYNTERRHSSLGMLSPVEFEAVTPPHTSTRMITNPTPWVSVLRGQAQFVSPQSPSDKPGL